MENRLDGAEIAEQQRQFDLARQDQMPWLEAGKWALPLLQQSYSGDNEAFFNSPDYLATQKQGMQFLDRSAVSRGGLFGGGHTKDLVGYGQDLAAQQLGNYRGGLAQLAGLGQNSAQSLGQFGANKANAIGNAYMDAGRARASSYLAQGDAAAGMANGISGIAGMLGGYYNSRPTYQPTFQPMQQALQPIAYQPGQYSITPITTVRS